MTWQKRLTQARLAKNLRKSELARRIGVSPSAVTQWENEGTEEIKGVHLTAVCAELEIDLNWLLFGPSSAAVTMPMPTLIASGGPANIEQGPNIRTEREYPVISWVQAGQWTELCDNFEPGNAEDWRPCHKNLGKFGYVLRVKGKSMTAPDSKYTFPEGYLLYVNPEAEATPGKFVIVRRKGNTEATFKRLVQGDDGLLLEAVNPDWPNRYLKLEEGDRICGVVMHARSDMP